MSSLSIASLRDWVKTSPSPIARRVYHTLYELRALDLPAPKLLYSGFYHAYCFSKGLVDNTFRVLLWTPMFKSRLAHVGRYLYLYGGMPYLAGPLNICIGDKCRISGRTTITGRCASATTPRLEIGSNCDIGWMTTIAVGSKVCLGSNVRLAGQCFLAGYPGHPLNALERAQGKPEAEHQVGDIIIENDVWLATGVSVMAGVRIGAGTVVAAQSVVTHDLPPNVIAAGIPAKVIRSLKSGDQYA